MNKELLLKIILELESYDQRKAHKLGELLDAWEKTPNCTSMKIDAEKKIKRQVYYLFTSLLSRKTRGELEMVGTDISEMCHLVEQSSANGWYINTSGAGRYVIEDSQIVTKAFIPREYQKGFNIDEKETISPEERKKEVDFLADYSFYLNIIAKKMDRKQEIITYDYDMKNKKVPKALVEYLISFLGFKRLTDEELHVVIDDMRKGFQKGMKHNPIH